MHLFDVIRTTAGSLFVMVLRSTHVSADPTGGCTTYSTANGFQVGVCISNMNGMALPDLYVTASPSDTDCYIKVDTQDSHAHSLGTTNVNCSLGHKIAFPVGPFSTDETLHALATLFVSNIRFGNARYSIGASPEVGVQATIFFDYNYQYFLASHPYPPPQKVLQAAVDNFQSRFPFPSCSVISVGQDCDLGPGSTNPSEVVSVNSTSFTFLLVPGHAEGAGRLITVSFIVDGSTNDLELSVYSRGPASEGTKAIISNGTAKALWQAYANNLKDSIAGISPRGI